MSDMLRIFTSKRYSYAVAGSLAVVSAVIMFAPVRAVRPAVKDAGLAPLPTLLAFNPGNAEDFASLIASRPLFSASRRPAASVGESALAEFRLAGVFADRRVRKAFFAPAGGSPAGARGKWVTVGDTIGGWMISAIEIGRVELKRGAQTLALTIGRAPTRTEREISQARAATPIYLPKGPLESPETIEARRRAIEAIYGKNDDGANQH